MGLTDGFFSRVSRLLFSAVVMGAFVWAAAHYGESLLLSQGRFFQRLGSMGILVTFGLFIYLAAVIGMQVYSLSELKAKFQRKA